MAIKIGVLGGDGIGPEVCREGLKVLDTLCELRSFDVERIEWPYGADHCIATGGPGKGVVLPDSIWSEIKELDAVFLGAIGDPRFEVGFLEFGIVGALRFKLDLYVNLRPIKLYSEDLCPLKGKTVDDLDMLVVRENTEDAYAGIMGFLKKNTPDEVAIQEMIYTRKGVERVIRYAYKACMARGKKFKLSLVDKANAIRAHDIWRRTFAEVGKEFPKVQQDAMYVDACTMWMVKNPESFDTVVTTNLFGDIITDLGAMLQGGLGIAAGGNINPGKVSMFEPIHGSAPKYKGKNVANPLAAINAMGMMLDHVGRPEEAALVEKAVSGLLATKRIPSLQAGAMACDKIGDMVCAEVRLLAGDKPRKPKSGVMKKKVVLKK
ncbi:MAG: 3-isopropylmalate dehydrogenase [Planctomycetes bacterium]|nr:3-isopropylmalate dehydrogenase [Planctomycetota bacterium]